MHPSCNLAGVAVEPAWRQGCTLVTSVTPQNGNASVQCNDTSRSHNINAEQADYGNMRRIGAEFTARWTVNKTEETDDLLTRIMLAMPRQTGASARIK